MGFPTAWAKLRLVGSAITIAHPDAVKLMPTSRPNAQPALIGEPRMMIAANSRSEMPRIRIQPHEAANASR